MAKSILLGILNRFYLMKSEKGITITSDRRELRKAIRKLRSECFIANYKLAQIDLSRNDTKALKKRVMDKLLEKYPSIFEDFDRLLQEEFDSISSEVKESLVVDPPIIIFKKD